MHDCHVAAGRLMIIVSITASLVLTLLTAPSASSGNQRSQYGVIVSAARDSRVQPYPTATVTLDRIFHVDSDTDDLFGIVDPSQGFGCNCVFTVTPGSSNLTISPTTGNVVADLSSAISISAATLTAAANADTPLIVIGHSTSQSADILDVFQSPSGTAVSTVGPDGGLTEQVASSSAVPLRLEGATGQTGNLLNAYQSDNTLVMSEIATGELRIAPTINSTNVLGNVAPHYKANGNNITDHATTHDVNDTCVFSGSTCTVTLSNNAIYTGKTTYSCVATPVSSSEIMVIQQSSGTSFTISNYVIGGTGTLTLTTSTDTVPFQCSGA